MEEKECGLDILIACRWEESKTNPGNENNSKRNDEDKWKHIIERIGPKKKKKIVNIRR